MQNETETGSPSPMFGSTWLTVVVVELSVISIINGFTILTFARNRHLRKRTTYLIINLTVAHFFVGTVCGPMHIYHTMTFERGSGFGWGKFIVMFLEGVFTDCSLLHLALLSLERLHATLFPFKHCLMFKLVYFKAGVCIWFLAVILGSAAGTFFLTGQDSTYIWASLILAVLFTVIVSYVIIALNMKRKAPPYSSGAVSSEGKLTVTILVVIVLSSLAFFPWFFDADLEISTRMRDLSAKAHPFGIQESFNVFFYADSFVNPLVYTLRMREFRKATRVWCGSANTGSRSQIIEMIKVTR